jgi:hypothetical protein
MGFLSLPSLASFSCQMAGTRAPTDGKGLSDGTRMVSAQGVWTEHIHNAILWAEFERQMTIIVRSETLKPNWVLPKSVLAHLWPWATYLTSLCFSNLICKREIMIYLMFWGCYVSRVSSYRWHISDAIYLYLLFGGTKVNYQPALNSAHVATYFCSHFHLMTWDRFFIALIFSIRILNLTCHGQGWVISI